MMVSWIRFYVMKQLKELKDVQIYNCISIRIDRTFTVTREPKPL